MNYKKLLILGIYIKIAISISIAQSKWTEKCKLVPRIYTNSETHENYKIENCVAYFSSSTNPDANGWHIIEHDFVRFIHNGKESGTSRWNNFVQKELYPKTVSALSNSIAESICKDAGFSNYKITVAEGLEFDNHEDAIEAEYLVAESFKHKMHYYVNVFQKGNQE